MKTRYVNDLIDRIGTVYVENDTELLWLIRPGAIYDENKTGEQLDRSYIYGLY